MDEERIFSLLWTKDIGIWRYANYFGYPWLEQMPHHECRIELARSSRFPGGKYLLSDNFQKGCHLLYFSWRFLMIKLFKFLMKFRNQYYFFNNLVRLLRLKSSESRRELVLEHHLLQPASRALIVFFQKLTDKRWTYLWSTETLCCGVWYRPREVWNLTNLTNG